jgi:hypothetical protein
MDEQRETLAGGIMRNAHERGWKRDHGGTERGAATHRKTVGTAHAVLSRGGVSGAMLFHLSLRENTRARCSHALKNQGKEYEAVEQASRHSHRTAVWMASV